MKHNCSVVVYAIGEYWNIAFVKEKGSNEGVYNHGGIIKHRPIHFDILLGSE